MASERRSFIAGLFGLVVGGILGRVTELPVPPIATVSGDGSSDNPYKDNLAHGELDEIYSRILYARLQTAPRISKMFSGRTCCVRCKFPWEIVSGYYSDMYEHGRGISMLCADCVKDLGDIELRIPYYAKYMKVYNWPNPDKVIKGLRELSAEARHGG